MHTLLHFIKKHIKHSLIALVALSNYVNAHAESNHDNTTISSATSTPHSPASINKTNPITPAQDQPFSGIASSLASSLLMAVILIAGIWYLKRIKRYQGKQYLKTISSVSVGTREKVVIVELDQTWLILGVTPQHVNLLHQQTKPQHQDESTNAQPTITFAQALKQQLSPFKKNHE